MIRKNKLHQYIEHALIKGSEKVYIKTAVSEFTYRQVFDIALEIQNILVSEGLEKGDRVVIYSSKNPESVSLMIACSLCECIYIPVSSMNPVLRAKYIIDETSAGFILCDDSTQPELLKTDLNLKAVFKTGGITLLKRVQEKTKTPVNDDTAFILFTSGSTGTPKGVAISHTAAIAFIDWAGNEFEINESDIIASIAPFNFDLSVFDIYVAAKCSSTLLLYSEEETKNALLMAQKLSVDNVTTVYATPTFYSTLAHYGKLNKYDYSSLKNVLFAGEVFHLEVFKVLISFWPGKKFANLYGPTETNVCTFFKIDPTKMDYSVFPIGESCEYATLLLVDENDKEIENTNTKGELLVAGESLFNEYWNDPVKTNHFRFQKNGINYYRTGDIVFKNESGQYVYVTRKDRMIKKNGFRIEPTEIEKVLMGFPGVTHVAVFFNPENNQLTGFLERPDKNKSDFIELKQYCQQYLPLYMIPDKFITLDAMPKTSSGKIDLQALNKMHE